MADLLLEKRKIVIAGKNRQRKSITEMRDSWEETVTKTANAGLERHSALAIMLPGYWLEGAPN